jgi:DNA-binding transcriptional MerR regulator
MSQQLDLFGNVIPSNEPQRKKVQEETIAIPQVKKEADKLVILEEKEVEIEEQKAVIIEPVISSLRQKPTIITTEIKVVEQEAILPKEKRETISQTVAVEAITEKRKRGRPRKEKPLIETPKVKLKRGRKPLKEIVVDVDFSNVPSDEELSKKLYYSIGTVAQWFNVTNSQIRFWENEFDILQPKKNGKGNRLFRQEDIKNLKTIYHLLRKEKLSLQGAKEYFKNSKIKTDVNMQLRSILHNIKSTLNELKQSLQ